MMDILNHAEWDVQLATGWTCDQIGDCPAERVLILYLRWTHNQLRFSGFMGIGKSKGANQSSVRDQRRADHWRSQTTEHGDGRVTKRINIDDLWNPAVAQMINQTGGQR